MSNTPISEMEVRERNRFVVEQYFRLQTEKNLDAWIELWDEAGEFRIPFAPAGFPDRIQGKATLGPLYKELFQGYGPLTYRNLQIEPLLDPNRFVATWHTHIELLNGGVYDNDLIALFFLRDGKIVRYDEYFDPIRFQAVVGS
ncbi:MAG TPA: nuclear transport factor 2 family protein [Ktedonobacteraceae bacterium]|nr:nuclear transport factor 2 family protein [Ktedonobacteraceae bacterium]